MEPSPTPETLDVRGMLRSIRARWRFVAGVTVAAAVLTLGITFIIPRWYRATAVVLPPEESDLLSNISLAQRALTKFPAFGILNDYFTPADVYKAILGSRTVQEQIVRRFDLQKLYRRKSMEKTLKDLRGHTKVKLNPDGTIQVSVEDRDPQRSADMTNAFIEALDRFNVEKRNSSARRTRAFLERRVLETDSLLRRSESALKLYQEKHGTVAPTSLNSSDLSAAADLLSRKTLLEVRLGVLRGYLREDQDEVVQTRNELQQLDRRIGQLPGLQNDLQRLIRDAKVYEQLYLLLTAELEQARLRETMDTPTVQLLDPAVPPERPSWPRRGLSTAAAGLLACALACGWVVARDRDPLPE
jgi:uncharacterized protein involved in exopolysaccharide biosynthesis